MSPLLHSKNLDNKASALASTPELKTLLSTIEGMNPFHRRRAAL